MFPRHCHVILFLSLYLSLSLSLYIYMYIYLTLALSLSHFLYLQPLLLLLRGAIRGLLEAERAFEMLTLGAYYKYSSTAFVTFRTRMAETIAHQMLLTNDMMEISHAPNPHDG